MSTSMLHPLQHPHADTAHAAGRSADAVDAAFGDVERSVRHLAGDLSPCPITLAEAAFAPATGPLTDVAAGAGAQLALQRLFMTGFARYRSRPGTPGAVNDDLAAIQGMTLAQLLTAELERIARRLGKQLPGAE